ncbi:MAG: hypothetical protein HYW86_03995 [Candidatus Roizmanbacteria bacterium]|nr:MAG: hypothetical protein HYW86_03995 [Candidatus Roizmanbacteria bacterium]
MTSLNQSYLSSIEGLNLYKYNEYPVIVGNPKKTTALCVVWQDREKVADHFPHLKEEFAIIGNLRSAFGINIILYNLALNPHIKNLVVWGPDKLSNTDIGITGKNTLLSLWQKGLKQNKQILGTDYKLVEEIDLSVTEKILKNVRLHDVRGQEKLIVSKTFKEEKPYMKPVIFPEFVVKSSETLPSEEYTYTIREKKGANAYLSLLYSIWKYGEKAQIDTGGEDLKEIRGAVVVVEDENPDDIYLPLWIKSKTLNFIEHNLENYYKTQFSADSYRKKIFEDVYLFERPRDYAYLYAELMYALPRLKEIDSAVWRLFKEKGYLSSRKFIMSNSQLQKRDTKVLTKKIEKKIKSEKKRLQIMLEAFIPATDQIAYVIERIKRKPADLDKEVVLWDVRRDTKLESGRPCINKLSFSVRRGKINVHVFARSHDIARAWFYNFYGVAKLLGKICKETGYIPGYIIIESESAHIYQRDWDAVKELVANEIQEKDPRMYFDPYLDSDPRGIVNISVAENIIKIKLQDTKSGKLLFEFDVKTAREALYKLKHYNFISRTDHAIFIGTELAKAELCIKLGIPYKYDNPIKLPSGKIIAG